MSKGFTLVELVVALLLLTIVGVFMWPRAPSPPSLTLNARAEQLASDIRYAQTLSMTRGQRYCLSLMPASGGPLFSGYSFTRASNACIATTGDPDHPAGLSPPIDICNGSNCITAPAALINTYVQFDGLGVPYTASSTPLAANAVFTLADGGLSQTVTISPTTGRVSVP